MLQPSNNNKLVVLPHPCYSWLQCIQLYSEMMLEKRRRCTSTIPDSLWERSGHLSTESDRVSSESSLPRLKSQCTILYLASRSDESLY